jgi:hypothetical protein
VAQAAAVRYPRKRLEIRKWSYSLGGQIKNNNKKHLSMKRKDENQLKEAGCLPGMS